MVNKTYSEWSESARNLPDEDLEHATRLVHQYVTRSKRPPLAQALIDESARRAEIRINRGMAAQYGPNPHGFTVEDVNAKHDAAWYESRQTEEQFLAESGVEA
jgi:ATP-dependent Clp protease ATP-binding subunit ClpA